MSLQRRISQIEKLLVDTDRGQEKEERDNTFKWFIKNEEEFKEYFKELWRLSWKNEHKGSAWWSWEEPYRQQAELLVKKMNEIINRHKNAMQIV